VTTNYAFSGMSLEPGMEPDIDGSTQPVTGRPGVMLSAFTARLLTLHCAPPIRQRARLLWSQLLQRSPLLGAPLGRAGPSSCHSVAAVLRHLRRQPVPD